MSVANKKYFSLLKPFLFSVTFIFFLQNDSIAQKTKTRFATAADAVIDSAKRRIASKSCNQISSYIPDTLHPEYSPMRYVRVNIHVIQDANGQNNFSGAAGRQWVKDIVATANMRVS